MYMLLRRLPTYPQHTCVLVSCSVRMTLCGGGQSNWRHDLQSNHALPAEDAAMSV